MNDIADYQVGDVLEITKRFTGKTEVLKVGVTNVDFKGNGLVTFYGYEAGAGAFDPKLVGKTSRFQHIISVKKVGHNLVESYRPPWSGLSHKDAMKYYGVG